MKKYIIYALLAAMLCSTLASCGNSADETVPAAEVQTESVETETETETIGLDLPEDLDYGGESIHIVKNPLVLLKEFNTEELTGDVVDDALYNSYTAVCERLNVNFDLIDVESSSSRRKNYVSAISKNVMAGSAAYDFISGYSMCFPMLAADGLLSDLLQTEHIDMEKPWWSSQLLDQSLINKKLYFATQCH